VDNISTNGNEITLLPNEPYYIIDALYLAKIGKQIHALDTNSLEKEIRGKIFPYLDTPFTKIKAPKIFRISHIVSVDDGDGDEDDDMPPELIKDCFSTDTGLLVIVHEKCFFTIAHGFDYGQLVDSNISPINIAYWNKITSGFSPQEIALVLAPGIDSGFDFEGSGTYRITET
jgi:hypothetical protein